MDFKLTMIFVDDDKTDQVLDASRAAGATGATIITSARGQGACWDRKDFAPVCLGSS